jgi:general secretion pathway protein G
MNRKRARRRAAGGFTLLEVLLVLAILVILGSMVTVYFVGIQTSANTNAARVQITEFEKALDLYKLQVGSYPSAANGLEALRVPPADLKNPQKWQGPYIKDTLPLDPWGNPYTYELLDTSAMSLTPYKIASWGADGVEGTEDDVSNIDLASQQ